MNKDLQIPSFQVSVIWHWKDKENNRNQGKSRPSDFEKHAIRERWCASHWIK